MTLHGAALLTRAIATSAAIVPGALFNADEHAEDIMGDDVERHYSLERVSDLTSISVSRIRELIKAGELVAVRWGREWRVRESDLKTFMEAREKLEIPERQRPGTSMDGAREARSKKVMRMLDRSTGLMECRVCGARHFANCGEGGRLLRGSWQCQHGCTLDELDADQDGGDAE
jgi:excisionase family DNA binding protein